MCSEIRRPERDVLNRNANDPSVSVVMGDDGIVGVTRPEGQTRSANTTFFPKWWDKRCTTQSK